MQREDQTDHGNGLGTNSSQNAVNHLSKSVVRDTEGAAKQKPHATFCGNRGRATAPGDPVGAAAMSPCTPIAADAGVQAGRPPAPADPNPNPRRHAARPVYHLVSGYARQRWSAS